MKRLACALVIAGCGTAATTTSPPETPARTAVLAGHEGWCGTRPWHQAVGSRDGVIAIHVAAGTLADVPAPRNPRFENGSQTWLGNHTARTSTTARIAGDTVELANPVHTCEETALGCVHGRSARWGGDVFATVDVPARTCIHYLVQLPGGLVLGTSAGTFAVRDGAAPVIVAAPMLEYLAELVSQTVLQEHAGPMWRARWDVGAAAPSFTPIEAVTARTLAFTEWNDIAYAFTADALIALDSTTLAERWRLPGEVHAVMIPDSGNEAAFVRIDRAGTQPQAVLDVRSQVRRVPGPVLRSRVVYRGPTIVDADLRILDETYQVLVAPR